LIVVASGTFDVACSDPDALPLLHALYGGEAAAADALPHAVVSHLACLAEKGESVFSTVVVSEHAIHVKRLCGKNALFVISIERIARRDSITRTKMRFGLTPRETEVLSFVLRGERAGGIATQLSISPTTVNDHFANLLRKTNSRNRAEMLAKVIQS
jgi:DNA-binding NarL/FixJ family response regulator